MHCIIVYGYLNQSDSFFEQRNGDDENKSSCRLIYGSVGRNAACTYKTALINVMQE